ncbi:MAG: sensor histidine kinase [Synechocystis sp.]
MNDLEQLQQENEALTLALQAQQEINHYKQFFLAHVAHELRSPLSSLISLQLLILHDLCETPAEEKEFLTDANLAAKKLLTMIDDLVTVAKIDYGKINLDYCPIAITDLFAELNHTIKLPVENHNFKLDFFSSNSLPLINGDRQKILWVLRNLIDRSLKISSDKSGIVKLAATIDRDSSKVRLILQLPCAPNVWQLSLAKDELTEILEANRLQKISQKFFLSPALTWQLVQTMIEKMGGSVAYQPGDLAESADNHRPQNSANQTLFVFSFPSVN